MNKQQITIYICTILRRRKNKPYSMIINSINYEIIKDIQVKQRIDASDLLR